MNQTQEKNSTFNSKRGKNVAFILIAIVLTFAYAVDLKELRQLPAILLGVHKGYILGAVICMLFFFLCQSVIVKRLLRAFGYPVTGRKTYQYTLIDYYFSSITPGASGGQPSEIYYMNKDGIPIGVSSLVMLLFNGLYHLAVLIVVAFSAWGHLEGIFGKNTLYFFLFIVGMLIQCALVCGFCFLIFSKHMVRRLAQAVVTFIAKFNSKRAASIEQKLDEVLDEYHEGAEWLKGHLSVVFSLIPVAILHILLYYTMTFWITHAFGIHAGSFREMVAYQAVFTMTFESLPLPSGVGLAETAFLKLFLPLYGAQNLTAAMLLTRGVTFYNFLLLGGMVTFLTNLSHEKVIDHGKRLYQKTDKCRKKAVNDC